MALISTSSKPLVTIALLTYRHELFVRDALKSAFQQTYTPLEICVTDDCSPDRTYDIILDELSKYKGPHKIIANRNSHNLGLADNFNRTWNLSSGALLVAMAGDDISVPTRVQNIVDRWLNTNPKVDLICSYFAEMDVSGINTGFVKKDVVFTPDTCQSPTVWKCGATGACSAYTRKLQDKYGPLDSRVISEDWVYPFRAWLENGISLIEDPLVWHRTHNNSISCTLKSISTLTSYSDRRARRHQSMLNRLGIATEWLKAWRIAHPNSNNNILHKLERYHAVCQLESQCYTSNSIHALSLAYEVLLHGGTARDFLRIIWRNVLKLY